MKCRWQSTQPTYGIENKEKRKKSVFNSIIVDELLHLRWRCLFKSHHIFFNSMSKLGRRLEQQFFMLFSLCLRHLLLHFQCHQDELRLNDFHLCFIFSFCPFIFFFFFSGVNCFVFNWNYSIEWSANVNANTSTHRMNGKMRNEIIDI